LIRLPLAVRTRPAQLVLAQKESTSVKFDPSRWDAALGEIFVSPADRARLEAIVADRNSASKHVWRARIVLATAEGLGTNAIMRRTGKSKPCVWRWQERYIAAGVEGLLRDKTRPARKKPLSSEVKLQVLTMTMQPPPNATHWSTRSMAKAVGISRTSVQRIWAGAELKPHLTRSFKVSNDPRFEEKVTDVVGLYMNPPDKALVCAWTRKARSRRSIARSRACP
jgi:transposase